MKFESSATISPVDRIHKSTFFIFVLIAQTFLAFHVSAFESAWVEGKSKGASVRLISELDEISETTREIKLGLEFKLKSGWHVYWKNPGFIGYPPKVQSQLPDSWKHSLLFPAPTRIALPQGKDQFAFGYEKSIIYPVLLQGDEAPQNFSATIKVNYLVCEVQCVPEAAVFKLELPVGSEKISSSTDKIEQAFHQIPAATTQSNFRFVSEKEIQFHFGDLEIKDLFFSSENDFRFSKPTFESGNWILRSEKVLPAKFEWTAVWNSKNGLTGITGIVERSIPYTAENSPLYVALFFAFIGGLILNLMPCVLPVIFLKGLSLIKLRDKKSGVRSSIFLTVAGILTSFAILAIFTICLQAFGHRVGWGFQFQSPVFVSFLIFVVFLFALNLFDLFDIQISSKSATRISLFQGDFFEGVFATLLATPCSAPFLGTALTYALSKPPAVLFCFFIVMGLGLATPLFFFLVAPKTLYLLPKPGAWMAGFKRLLGYTLLLTVLWLLYIAFQQTESFFLFGVLLILSILFIAIREFEGAVRWILVVALLMTTLYLADYSRRTHFSKTIVAEESFSEENLEKRLAQGEIIFLEVSADWCLTCKFNEKSVIETEWFQNLLASKNVKLVKLDWTQQDATIGNFLNKYHRVGIPFSVLLSSKKSQTLPELLTRTNVEKNFAEFFAE